MRYMSISVTKKMFDIFFCFLFLNWITMNLTLLHIPFLYLNIWKLLQSGITTLRQKSCNLLVDFCAFTRKKKTVSLMNVYKGKKYLSPDIQKSYSNFCYFTFLQVSILCAISFRKARRADSKSIETD